jgi:hypothetical protein
MRVFHPFPRIRILPFFLAVLLAVSGCGRKDKDRVILARVGDRDITLKEFQYRSEFTIRPKYISKSGPELNRILLDNLIAEKILALEAGDTCRLAKNKVFNSYIQGIREQSMREELFFKAAYNKVKVDTQEIKSMYRFAGREYRVAFYSIRKDELAREIVNKIATDPGSAAAVFDGISGGAKPPEKQVSWKDPSSEPVFDALFTHPVSRDTVIGPLRLDKNLYVMMKVLDWKDEIAFGGEDAVKRWNDVTERIRKRESNALWNKLLERLIGGKTIRFNAPVFRKMSDLSYELFTASGDTQSKDILGDFLKRKADASPSDAFGNEEAFLKSPFLTFDGKTWTVEDFKNELAVHPLVYRTKNFTKQTFPREFKNAVADLIKDHELTREAYGNGIQKKESIRRNESIWRDAAIASWKRDEMLDVLARKHSTAGRADALTRVYVEAMDSLMKAYSGKIRVNVTELQKIQLTNSDMVVYKPGVPYPMAVPNFQAYIFRQ